MKRKKVRAFFMACCMAAIFGGCGSALETGETVVVPKVDEAGADADAAGFGVDSDSPDAAGVDVGDAANADEAGTAGANAVGAGMAGANAAGAGTVAAGNRENAQNGASGQVAEQVNAPQTYQMDLKEGKISVTADAAVVIPVADGFRKKRVKPRVFTQEDYDTVNRILLDGGKLWNRDVEAMGANGFTKAEIQERIDLLKLEMAAGKKESDLYGGKEINYAEALKEWEKMLETAPDEAVMVAEDAVVGYEPGNDEKNSLSGFVAANGMDYSVWLKNSMDGDWYWSIFQVEAPRKGSNYLQVAEETAVGADFSTDEIRKEAEALVEALGFSEYGYAGEEYVVSYGNETSDGTLEKLDTGYCIHFTRQIDGINVNYAAGEGMYTEQQEDIVWPAEYMDVIYNENGFVGFDWESPYEIEDVSDEYVFLLPFSDIQDIFEKMMLEKYGSDKKLENVIKAEYHVDRVQLGYMRVRENGAATEGMMIPVWDFYGTETFTMEGDDAGEGNTAGNTFAYESLLTVNAMDGTIVDKKLGY